MSDKRIDPTTVPDLFKRLGMRPERGTFGNGIDCGCLATALAIDGGMMPPLAATYCVQARDWADAEFGGQYSSGLRMGWDGYPSYEYLDRTNQGFEDGAEAARLVFGETGA